LRLLGLGILLKLRKKMILFLFCRGSISSRAYSQTDGGGERDVGADQEERLLAAARTRQGRKLSFSSQW